MSYILTDDDCETIGNCYDSRDTAGIEAQKLANSTGRSVTIWSETDTVEPEEEDDVDDENENENENENEVTEVEDK